jgi:CheY-like chemotaxis protein
MTSERLLVIDDEADFANFVARVARGLGFDVEIVTESRAFKSVIARFVPDIIVLDLVMPDIDGIDIIRFLAESGSRARVVVTTGFNPAYARAACGLGIANGRLSVTTLLKPVTLAELRASLVQPS